MTCRAFLIRPKDDKVLKTEHITKDTYLLCEEEITKRNAKLNNGNFWKITEINI